MTTIAIVILSGLGIVNSATLAVCIKENNDGTRVHWTGMVIGSLVNVAIFGAVIILSILST